MFSCNSLAVLARGLHQLLDLGVHDAGGVFAVVARMTPIAANKDFLALLADGHGADDIAHAPFANHLAGHARSALNVVAGTGGNRVEDDFSATRPASNTMRLFWRNAFE